MVAALAGRELGGPVNRKRVQRLMREHALLQRRRSEGRRRRPRFFRVKRPDQLWHLDMTSVWVAEHRWCTLNAAIDCCTRETTAWALDVRCRAPEAIAVIESWFSKPKQRCIWREEFETLDDAREQTSAYVQGYHHRPHSRLAYRTPREDAATRKDHDDQQTPAA